MSEPLTEGPFLTDAERLVFIRSCVRSNPGGFTDDFKFLLATLDAARDRPGLDVDVLPDAICDLTGGKHPELVERRMVKRLMRGNAEYARIAQQREGAGG